MPTLLIAVLACALLGAMAAPGVGASTSRASLVPDNGPCDKSEPVVELGIITVFESPVLSLVDQVTAAEASVTAFNKRGGVGGRCMKLVACDDGADPNQAADCARQMADSDVVATINDTTAVGNQGVIDILQAAGIPRFEVSPSTEDLTSPNSYAIGAGGAGTTFMMAPPLLKTEHKKIYIIGVDVPTIGTFPALMKPMADSYGAEIVGLSKVPAGTTDFQQFVLAAEDAGADGVILPLGENEAVQVLQAAKQLNSKLDFSVSLGTFGKDDIKEFGSFAKQMYFNAELPPITASAKKWPILPTVISDLSKSGDKELQKNQIKSSPFRSWVAVVPLREDDGEGPRQHHPGVGEGDARLRDRRRLLRADPAVDAESGERDRGRRRCADQIQSHLATLVLPRRLERQGVHRGEGPDERDRGTGRQRHLRATVGVDEYDAEPPRR